MLTQSEAIAIERALKKYSNAHYDDPLSPGEYKIDVDIKLHLTGFVKKGETYDSRKVPWKEVALFALARMGATREGTLKALSEALSSGTLSAPPSGKESAERLVSAVIPSENQGRTTDQTFLTILRCEHEEV